MKDPEALSSFEKAFEGVAVIACTLAFTAYVLGICILLLTGNKPGGRDVVSYWVAGHQVLHHADPYDSATVLRIERTVGFPLDAQSLIMRNPPSALALVLPLGFVGFASRGSGLVGAFAGSADSFGAPAVGDAWAAAQ